MNENKFDLFYMGTFSQWHKSKFVIEGITFTHAEQYMMYGKAMLFGDTVTAQKILKATHPKEQKSLGRQVQNYDEAVWVKHREDVVYKGNYAKFTQNPKMLEELLTTTGILVEASPYDRIWGIGRGLKDPLALDPKTWNGLNLLGFVLTKLREDLKNAGN